jgi:predicted Zn-dependent protease
MKEFPENMTAWRVYARAAVEANDFESAIESLDHVIANSAMTAETWVLLSYVALRSGDSARSRQAGNRAILEEPGLAAAHFLVAEAAEIEGDVAAARESYRQVLKLEPDFEPAARRLNLLSMRVEAASPEFAGDCPDDASGMEP